MVHRVTESQTWLKQLGTHTHSSMRRREKRERERSNRTQVIKQKGQRTGLYSTCISSLSSQLYLFTSLVCLSRTHRQTYIRSSCHVLEYIFPLIETLLHSMAPAYVIICHLDPWEESIPTLLTTVCLTPSICLGLRRCSKINFEWINVQINNKINWSNKIDFTTFTL